MIFLPVSPASPSGPPITNLPVGLTCQIVFSVIQPSGKVSKTYGKVHKCILSEKNKRSIFIPQGFAHGFQSLDNENYIIYSCTKYRNKKSEVTIKFDEKKLNIKWPNKKIVISEKDKNGISLSEFKKKYL